MIILKSIIALLWHRAKACVMCTKPLWYVIYGTSYVIYGTSSMVRHLWYVIRHLWYVISISCLKKISPVKWEKSLQMEGWTHGYTHGQTWFVSCENWRRMITILEKESYICLYMYLILDITILALICNFWPCQYIKHFSGCIGRAKKPY